MGLSSYFVLFLLLMPVLTTNNDKFEGKDPFYLIIYTTSWHMYHDVFNILEKHNRDLIFRNLGYN